MTVSKDLHSPGCSSELTQLLTVRQRQVLQARADGLSNAEIAATLQISEETVKSHTKAIRLKLQARDRTQAVVIGLQSSLVQLRSRRCDPALPS